jgi:hypothetical protein
MAASFVSIHIGAFSSLSSPEPRQMAPAQTVRVVLRIPDRRTGVKINSQMKEPAARRQPPEPLPTGAL